MAADEQIVKGVESDEERRRLQALLEAERQAAAAREAAAAAEAQHRQAQKLLERESRPYPLRLTEQRCTGCHGLEELAHSRHGWLGWWVTVLRMEILHGARIGPGERAPIVAHLARSQPATPPRQAAEWVVAALAAGGFAWFVVRWIGRAAGRRVTPENAGEPRRHGERSNA